MENHIDWGMYFVALMGPLFAVQAQRRVDFLRARLNEQRSLFTALLKTRAKPLSDAHVESLNLVNVVFYGRRFFGWRFQTRGERRVCDAWAELYAHLCSPRDPAAMPFWLQRRSDKFTDLMFVMAECVSMPMARHVLQGQHYSPEGHVKAEERQEQLALSLLSLLTGSSALNISVSPPGSLSGE